MKEIMQKEKQEEQDHLVRIFQKQYKKLCLGTGTVSVNFERIT